ncbi:MAG: RteC domain-containing protein, partial [Bacteroidales bacterium]|nr:RteC domain-containing protein [Bacteroidales bacterium]
TDKGICLFKAISIVGSHRKVVESLISKDVISSKQRIYVANQDMPKLVWTSTIRDLVELIYALHYTKSFNNGEMTLKETVHHFEQFFGVKIDNFSHSFLRIRERMKERTVFVSKLQNTLESKIIEKDQ